MCLACALGDNTQAGSKQAAGDDIHAQINCTDTYNNGTLQVNHHASSLLQLILGAYYPSTAFQKPRIRGTIPTAVDGHTGNTSSGRGYR